MRHSLLYIFLVALVALSCDKGEKFGNERPDTKIIPHVVNLEGDNRLRSTVDLAWFGSDVDGYIKGYEYSLDNQVWHYTTETDTTFIFEITGGSDTLDIEFYVRAIDNENEKDLTPAHVIVPIKNTPPVVTFDEALSTKDTAFIVSSIFWNANDDDGIENLNEVEIKINNGSWYKIDKKYSSLTLVPENPSVSGPTDSKVYFETGNPETLKIDGLVVGDTNVIYIRATDVANSLSEEDTLSGIFVKRKSSDLIVIGGDRDYNSFYTARITNAVSSFDYIDYAVGGGKWQPAFWNTTFFLMISEYDKLCIFSDKNDYLNASTGLSSLILESSARPIQDYTNNGGKVFTIGYFDTDKGVTENSLIFSVYPIESMDFSSGNPSLARSDTALISQDINYPSMGTTSFPKQISPFKESSDAVVIYKGDMDSFSSYTGPSVLGVKRTNGTNTNMVFVGAGLNIFSKDYTQVDSLFKQVLINEFNW